MLPDNTYFRLDCFSKRLAPKVVIYCLFNAQEGDAVSLLNYTFQDQVKNVLKYIENGDLRRWSLPDITAFGIGISQWRSKLNCITNPHMYEQVRS